MKYLLLTAFMLTTSIISAQNTKPIDQRNQLEKEDSNNLFNTEDRTNLDILQALELASIRINKFDIGTFEKSYQFKVFADTYINGSLSMTDTLISYTNEYSYWVDKEHYIGFIDQLKIFTKTDDNKSTLKFQTYALSTKKDISLQRSNSKQFFNWREFKDTKWQLNEKVPLLVFASSWEDKTYGFQRFCGIAKLTNEHEQTKELLTSSPHYIIISYKITEIPHDD